MKKIGLICFSILVFSALFFAPQSDAFAQRVYDPDYSSIVQDYKATVFTTPRSGDEYDREKSFHDEAYGGRASELLSKHLANQAHWEREKRKCQKWQSSKFWKSKGECEWAMERNKDEDAGQYLNALEEIQSIYRERIRKLKEALNKMTYQQRIRTRQNRIQMKKEREEKFKKIYKRRTN